MHVAEVPNASLESPTVTAPTDAVPLGTAEPVCPRLWTTLAPHAL